MTIPTPSLDDMRAATANLLDDLTARGWTDRDAHAPSLLPGWTRGHVLTHLARNADGIERTVSGALRGERLDRYPHGTEGRNADIEAGATRPAAELLADLRSSADRLDTAFAAVAAAGAWQLECDDRTTGAYVGARWGEVEIHRVDLADGYSPRSWPAAFVRAKLPEVVAGLDARIAAGRAVRIEVEPAGSTVAELAGTVWTCGGGTEPDAVAGPDWAILAWALGRPDAAREAIGALPELAPWR
jgi:maleylpyruvate isomerase